MDFKRYQNIDHLPFISVNTLLGTFTATLITEKHVYFVNPEEGDENGSVIMFWNSKGMPLLSNNYFAHQGYCEALATEEMIWVSDELAEMLKDEEFQSLINEIKEA